MIRVLFFGSVRERLGVDGIELEAAVAGATAMDLRTHLAGRDGAWGSVFADDQRLLVAINQQITGIESSIDDGDEVAFFPPVTGG